MNGFAGIWEILNNIVDDQQLLTELARFPKRTEEEIRNFKTHYDKHKSYVINGVTYTMTPEEYDDSTHYLSSYPAIPIGTGEEYEIFGYIAQDGRKIKFTQIPGGAFMVAYVGKDVTGEARSFHYTSMEELLYNINPYHKILDYEDHRYKSDLDGKFEGLKFFKPIIRGPRAVTQEEVERIKSDILNRRKISIK